MVAISNNTHFESDWLVYNAPPDFVEVILCSGLEGYLRRMSDPYSRIESNS